LRCSLSIIAEAIITTKNCNVMGNIAGYPALSGLPFQAPYPPEFMRGLRRWISGHHGMRDLVC
jgi:hypothetical protein